MWLDSTRGESRHQLTNPALREKGEGRRAVDIAARKDSRPLLFFTFVKASPYLFSLEAVRNELARPRRESVKISHFDGSKLYQRGPLR